MTDSGRRPCLSGDGSCSATPTHRRRRSGSSGGFGKPWPTPRAPPRRSSAGWPDGGRFPSVPRLRAHLAFAHFAAGEPAMSWQAVRRAIACHAMIPAARYRPMERTLQQFVTEHLSGVLPVNPDAPMDATKVRRPIRRRCILFFLPAVVRHSGGFRRTVRQLLPQRSEVPRRGRQCATAPDGGGPATRGAAGIRRAPTTAVGG